MATENTFNVGASSAIFGPETSRLFCDPQKGSHVTTDLAAPRTPLEPRRKLIPPP